jgi:hypothetical protein
LANLLALRVLAVKKIRDPQSQLESPHSAFRLLLAALSAAFLVAIFFVLLLAALHKQLNHDENMYVSSGILLDHGQLPYKDFAYFQMPLLTLFYAPALWNAADPLFVARLLNTVFTFLTCLLLFVGSLLLSRGANWFLRALIAVSGVVLFISNPELIYAGGIAWNHDLPILLTVAAVSLLVLRSAGSYTSNWLSSVRPALLMATSGLLLGLAGVARLTFLAAIPPLALAVLLFGPADQPAKWSSRVRDALIFCAGAVVGTLPALLFLIADPSSFWFGNVTYHQLNEQYWAQLGYTRAMTISSKLTYFSDVLWGEPFHWLLIAGSILTAIAVARSKTIARKRPAVLLPAVVAVALLVGGLAPTPTWLQYFLAPYALLVVALVYGVACLSSGNLKLVGSGALLVVTLISANAALPHYEALDSTLTFADGVPAHVHATANEIRTVVGKGTVVTFAPLYALEAGLDIYPELESGPFAARVANQLPAAEREKLVMMSDDDLVAAMQVKPPDAILLGTEGPLEDPLAQFAAQHSYQRFALEGGLTLWKATNPTGQAAQK